MRENHYLGRTADLSPLDLAPGWKRMADPAVYGPLALYQSGRTLFATWPDPLPIPMQEVTESVANVHTIAANPTIKRARQEMHKGAFVRMAGQLVEVTRENWGWTSSLSRLDARSLCAAALLCRPGGPGMLPALHGDRSCRPRRRTARRPVCASGFA